MLGKVGAGREVAFQQGLVEWYSLLGTSSWGGGVTGGLVWLGLCSGDRWGQRELGLGRGWSRAGD